MECVGEMKKLISIILIIMMILGAVACNSTKSNESKEEVKETEKKTDSDTDGEEVKETEKKTDSDTDGEEVERKPFKIGFSVWGTSDSHGRYVSQAASWVEELGGEVIVDVAQGFTIDAQVASIENLIQSGADIVSFCAYSGEAVIPKYQNWLRKMKCILLCGILLYQILLYKKWLIAIHILWVQQMKVNLKQGMKQ